MDNNLCLEVNAETKTQLAQFGIDTEESVFPQSCRVACLKLQLENQINADSKICNAVYLDDESYKKKCLENHEKKDMHIAVRAILSFILGGIASTIITLPISLFFSHDMDSLTTFAQTNVKGMLTLAGVVGFVRLVIRIAATVWIWKMSNDFYKKRQEKGIQEEIEAMLPQYREEREANERWKPGAAENISKNKQALNVVQQYLVFLCQNREAIPEAYWQYGGEFLYLFSTRRADNVKEAINLWEEILHQERMEAEQRRQGMVIDNTNQLAAEARAYAQSAAIASAISAINSSEAASYARSAYYNTF